MARLEGRVDGFDAGFGSLKRRIDALHERLSGRIEALDQSVSGRTDVRDRRLSGSVETLDRKVSRQFIWTIGVQVAVLLAVVTALVAR